MQRIMFRNAKSTVEIKAPVETVYGYWETLENLPDFMTGVKEVRRLQPDNTLWRVKGPFGRTLEWEARTILKEPCRRIEWIPTEGNTGISGDVRFEETGTGRTRIEARLVYANPSGERMGGLLSRALDRPHLQLEQDLESLKDHLEGRATLEEVRRRSTAVGLQSRRVLGFVVLGVLLVATGILSVMANRRRQSRAREAARVLKFDRSFWDLVLEAIITSR